LIRPLARERESWWGSQPMVAITRRVARTDLMPTDPGYGAEERHTQVLFSDWSPTNQAPHEESVEIYSNCKEVELFLNGKSLGSKIINADAAPRVWNVTYAPGTLKAVARNNGKVAATDELRTAGKPAKIVLTTDAKKVADDFDGVAVVRATIVDSHGITIPQASDLITFKVSGPGVVAAVDNGGNSDPGTFQTNALHAYLGTGVAFVKATAAKGKITLAASADGLAGDKVTLQASPELSR
jgi:beta-galactosidase